LKAHRTIHLRRLALVALGAAACANFADVSTVSDLRVLAIVADPSEVVLKVNGLPDDPLMTDLATLKAITIDPASIPTITLAPVVVDPRPSSSGRAFTYDLVGCPNNPYGAAPPLSNGGAAPDPSGGARTTVGSTLCDGAKVSWPLGTGIDASQPHAVTLTPEMLLQALATDLYVDQDGRPHGGFDLGLPVNLQLTLTNGVDTLKAVKRVLFWARPLPGQVPNELPTIPGVRTYPDRVPETWAPVEPIRPLDKDAPLHVPLGGGLWIEPLKAKDADGNDADAEPYVTTVIDRDPPHLAIVAQVPRERLRYAYFATAGHFDPPRKVNELPPGVTGTIHLESHYVPPATLDDVPADAKGDHLVTIWIVVRDDRGGEAWVSRQLVLDP
jgi:hypothetical protein